MKKEILIIVLIVLIPAQSFCQIVFEKAYYISDSDEKVNCLIKNVDWLNNPDHFSYKLTEEADEQEADINSVKEFCIIPAVRYVKAEVKMDRSSNDINKLTHNKIPDFNDEILFLRVLVEGGASLFYYRDGDVEKFFYRTKESSIEQLLYKQYLVDQSIAENNTFRQQLFVDLKCEGITDSDFKSIKYRKNDLVRIFSKYNECIDNEFVVYKPEKKESNFYYNIAVKAGLNLSSLSLNNSAQQLKETDFDHSMSVRFGAELEAILPFNNSKWGIFIEPSYQYFNSESESRLSGQEYAISYKVTADYQSFEIPIGVRHYFYLNNDFKIFVDAAIVMDIPFNSSVEFFRDDTGSSDFMDITSELNQAIGLGFKYKDRYGLQIKYYTNRDIFAKYNQWSADYKATSFIFSYTLF